MKKLAMITVLISIAALALVGCASTGAGKAEKKVQAPLIQEATVKPSGLLEDCIDITDRQKMDYSFTSSHPLNFYIHYHEEGNRFELDNQELVTAAEGTFFPNKANVYCLTWTNPHTRSVDLSYSFIIGKK